jgi:hypothetical protein
MRQAEPMMTNYSTGIDWDIILQTIKEEKCILCLGPDVFTESENQRIEDMLNEALIADNPDVRNYYPGDGLFLFNSEDGKTRFFYKLKRFYEQSFPATAQLLAKLACIPFHLIITVTPDELLGRAFSEQNLTYKTDFYWKNRTPATTAKLPNRQHPLIYNIFGSVSERDSLVLTYQDLFDYFDSIFGARSMPTELKKIISETDNFLFLGIQFEKWYMQLLLRILGRYNVKDSFLRYATSLNVNDQIVTFCQEQFRITFVREKIPAFVDQLLARCLDAGLERRPSVVQTSVLAGIRKQVGKGEVESALTQLRTFLESSNEASEELFDELVLLTERNNRLMRRLRNGTIEERDAEVKRNQITETLLHLIRQAELFES